MTEKAELVRQLNVWREEEKEIDRVRDEQMRSRWHRGSCPVHQTREELLQIAKDKKQWKLLRQYMRDSLRPATVRDYDAWLLGFLEGGGKPTHYYDYAMRSAFRIAERDFTSVPLFGARSMSIIVPVGITVNDVGWLAGHNDYYFMDGFTTNRNGAPVYKDTLK